MAWGKIKIFGINSLAGLTSNLGVATGYTLDNLFEMYEGTYWKPGAATDPVYVTFDAGAGNTEKVDYLGIANHNLNTIGATISLEYSTDNFSGDINDAFTPFAPANDYQLVKEFTQFDTRYSRWKIADHSAEPEVAIAIWGETTELDYGSISGPFDPNAQIVHANINLSRAGYVTGVHTKYTERAFDFTFAYADSDLYNKLTALWEATGINNVFVGWETTEHSTEVYLMYPETKFVNPMTHGGLYRTITRRYKGRKE